MTNPFGRAALILSVAQIASCAQAPLPPNINTELSKISIRLDGNLRRDVWSLKANSNPDELKIPVKANVTKRICYVTEIEEICFDLRAGSSFRFAISQGGNKYPQLLTGILDTPIANFSPEYQSSNHSRITFVIPEVYELVNVGFALTRAEAEDRAFTPNTDYKNRVLQYFGKHKEHPFVAALDKALDDYSKYHRLKMNGYAFEFDTNGKIIPSQIYDRIGSIENSLRPMLPLMQSFAVESEFRTFFASEQAHYKSLKAMYEELSGAKNMMDWLQSRFPQVKPFDTVKVIFSPLVGGMQSSTVIESNGFRELQTHINALDGGLPGYPYSGLPAMSARGNLIERSAILFTELNHGFLTPAGAPFEDSIGLALGETSQWADAKTGYRGARAIFDEYMNWALVSLYNIDNMDSSDWELNRPRLEGYMIKRGFKRFTEFNTFLISEYKAKGSRPNVTALYPEIVKWFEKNRNTK